VSSRPLLSSFLEYLVVLLTAQCWHVESIFFAIYSPSSMIRKRIKLGTVVFRGSYLLIPQYACFSGAFYPIYLIRICFFLSS